MTKAKQKLRDGGDYIISTFFGLNTSVKDVKELVDGQPQDSLNWITGWNAQAKTADNIQLRTGSALLHKTRLGAGKVNAIAVGQDTLGNQVPFWIAGGKAYYYNSATGDYTLVSNGNFTTIEDMTMEFYQDLFGPYMYASSPNNSLYGISVANKQMISVGILNVTAGENSTVGAYLTIRQNFGWLWNYVDKKTGISYLNNINQSNPDQVAVSDTSISSPQGKTSVTGDGVTLSFAGTLPASGNPQAFQVQVAAPINSMPVTSFVMAGAVVSQLQTISYSGGFTFSVGDYVVIQGSDFEAPQVNDIICLVTSAGAGSIGVTPLVAPSSGTNNTYSPSAATLSKLELFEDDGNGGLKSLLGSSGTVNYISQNFTITTQTAVPNGLNVDALFFSGTPGVVNFAPGSWSQHGGSVESVKFFNNQLYCFHTISTWLINLGYSSQSVTTGTQQMYRENLGIPFFRSAYEKGDGVLFLDNTQQNNPHFRILQISDFNNATTPEDLSADLDLSLNDFSNCKVHSVGNFDFLSCKSTLNGTAKSYNETTYLRNNLSGYWDKTDFRIADMDTYNGTILAGDTITQNILQIFTGVDDDGAPINNNWTSGIMDLGFRGGKRFNYFYIDGYIGPSQVLNIYAQFDNGSYIYIGSIFGNGPYVDQNDSIVIGQGLSGLTPVGGQGNGQIMGYHFERQMPYYSPIFNDISIQFVAGVNLTTYQPAFGACQIDAFGFKDCRIKTTKLQPQYIS